MDKVSVIIPVYNVQEYLERCLNSVINQTYRNLEIILVDDGSADESGKICDLYAKRDNRITVIHKKNGGLSDARNVGIDNASGKYLSFIDSDDFVDVKFIQAMHSLIVEHCADIAICGYEKGKKDFFSYSKKRKKNVVIFDSEQMLEQWHGKNKHVETVAWNKLYKRELFINYRITYPIGYYNEDVQTTHLLINKAKKIVMTNDRLYYYYHRSNSIINTLSEKSIKDNIYGQYVRLDFFKTNNYLYAYRRLYTKLMKYYMLTYCRIENSEKRKIEQELLAQYKSTYPEIMKNSEITILEKILFWGFAHYHLEIKKIYKVIQIYK